MERITLVYFILVLCVSYGYSQRLQSPCPDVFSYESDGYKYYGRIVIRNTFSASQIKLDVHFSVAGPANGGGSLELQNSNNALSSFNRGTPMQYVLSFPEARSIPSITAIIVNGQRICAGPGLRRNQYIINFSLSHTAYLSGSQYGYNPQPEPPMYPNNYETETIEPVYSPPTYPETYQDPGRLPNNNNYGYDTGVIQTPRPVIQTWVQPTTTQAPQQLYSQGPTTHRQPESSVGCGTVSSKITLIYEGQDFKKGEIPWLAAIFKKSKGSLMFICGGTLVSNRHIVTAAHCVHTSYKQLLVRLGVQGLYESFDRDTAPKGLIDAAVHPDYNNHSNYENDIAVLTLKERLSFNDYVRPACLWTGDTSQELIVGMTGTVAGWGDQSRRGGAAEIPKRISLPIVSTTRCRDSSVYLQDYTSQTSFCAGERDGSGPCSGDSGGGLYIYQGDKWRLRGIVSVSVGDQERLCNLREYVVFTDAAQFIPWIRSIINKDYYD